MYSIQYRVVTPNVRKVRAKGRREWRRSGKEKEEAWRRGITPEGVSRMQRMERMERIGNRHSGDFLIASHTEAKSLYGPNPPMTLRLREM